MHNRELIIDTLIKRMKDDSNNEGCVIILTGEWGCGKTFLWNNDVLGSLKGYNPITISLFGLNNIDDLKSQLMTKSFIHKGTNINDKFKKMYESMLKKINPKTTDNVIKNFGLFIGNNLISKYIDPLELVGKNQIICFDDVERISPDLKAIDLLGTINLLSEIKHCKILLIMDEDKFKEKDSYEEYKERIVDSTLYMEFDPLNIYDILIKKYKNKDNFYSFLKKHKELIIRPMINLEHKNLRTLKRIIGVIAEINSFNHKLLEPKYIPSLAALMIEYNLGKLKKESFYDFNPIVLEVMNDMSGQQELSGNALKQLAFYNNYFQEKEDYFYVKSIYHRITLGYFDWESLSNELHPPEVAGSHFFNALSLTQEREWWFYSDDEFNEWIQIMKDELDSDRPITTLQLVMMLIYLDYTIIYTKIPIDSYIHKKIKERLDQNAIDGDESFTVDESEKYIKDKNIWEPYLKDYDKKVNVSIIQSKIQPLTEAIRDRKIDTIKTKIYRKPRGLEAIFSTKCINEIKSVYFINRKFFDDIIFILTNQLSSNELKDLINDIDGKRDMLSKLIDELLTHDDLDNSGEYRLNKMKETYQL